MDIRIIAVGKVKERYLREGIAEYSKRLGRYGHIDIVEAREESAPESLSEKEMEQVKEREGSSLIKLCRPGACRVALAIEGDRLGSEDLARYIRDLETGGTSRMDLIIGGSLGLSREVLQSADKRLSFSPMTFPHQLMRLILLEQLYRAAKINRGEVYHK